MVFTGCLFGQNEAPIRVDVKVVNVLCTVYDSRHALVKDLTKAISKFVKMVRHARSAISRARRFAAHHRDVGGRERKRRSFLREGKDTAVGFFRSVLRRRIRPWSRAFRAL